MGRKRAAALRKAVHLDIWRAAREGVCHAASSGRQLGDHADMLCHVFARFRRARSFGSWNQGWSENKLFQQ